MTVGDDALTHADRELRARLRFILIALMIVFPAGWVAYFYPFDDLFDRSGMQLGGDFPVFYVQARFAAEGRWKDLYDFAEQGRDMRRFLPGMAEEKFLPALYPPWTAALLRPLAFFSYPAAYAVFFGTSVLLLAQTVWSWTRAFPFMQGPWRSIVWLSLFGSPLILETLISGQASIIAVAVFGIGAALLMRDRPILAGIVLGLAAYKPNVLAIVLLGVGIRWPRALIGMAITGAALLALTTATAGLSSIQDYLQVPSRPEAQSALSNPPIPKFHGLAASTPFTRTTPYRAVGLALALVGLVAAVRSSRMNRTKPGETPIYLATLGILQLLGNPYLPVYDLALLFPIAFLFVSGLAERYGPSIGKHSVFAHVALAVLFFGAHASQAIASSIGWQPFGWLFVPAAAWGLWELAGSKKAESNRQSASGEA
jgi:hypothetical protein